MSVVEVAGAGVVVLLAAEEEEEEEALVCACSLLLLWVLLLRALLHGISLSCVYVYVHVYCIVRVCEPCGQGVSQ